MIDEIVIIKQGFWFVEFSFYVHPFDETFSTHKTIEQGRKSRRVERRIQNRILWLLIPLPPLKN